MNLQSIYKILDLIAKYNKESKVQVLKPILQLELTHNLKRVNYTIRKSLSKIFVDCFKKISIEIVKTLILKIVQLKNKHLLKVCFLLRISIINFDKLRFLKFFTY